MNKHEMAFKGKVYNRQQQSVTIIIIVEQSKHKDIKMGKIQKQSFGDMLKRADVPHIIYNLGL